MGWVAVKVAVSPHRPPLRDALVESLPHPSGSTEQHLRVSLASGGHALQLTGDGLDGVAEPEAFAVEAAGQGAEVVGVVVHREELIQLRLESVT